MKLQVEEGPKEREQVHYMRKILAIEADGHFDMKFLRVKSPFTRDMFSFPEIEDVTKVERWCKGVLVTQKRSTATG